MKIYVANHTHRISLQDLDSFGDDVVIMTQGMLRVDQMQQLYERAKSYVEHSSDDDCLVLLGPAFFCSMVFHAWMQKHGRVTLLHWDNRERKYTMYHVHES